MWIAGAGCGAASSAAAPGGVSPEPSVVPTTADEAERVLERERRTLDGSIAPPDRDASVDRADDERSKPSPPAPVTAGAPPSPAELTSPKKAQPPPADAQEPGRRAEATGASSSPCAVACRAFASMQRAADVICRELGEEHDRCRSARTTVASAKARVAACGCAER